MALMQNIPTDTSTDDLTLTATPPAWALKGGITTNYVTIDMATGAVTYKVFESPQYATNVLFPGYTYNYAEQHRQPTPVVEAATPPPKPKWRLIRWRDDL